MPFKWIRTIPTEYQPLKEDSDYKSPSFLQHPSQVCKVGHFLWSKTVTVMIKMDPH